ncbi:MAG: MBL fold metallo-hydrolase, partial [Gaiellaceae bacterium]
SCLRQDRALPPASANALRWLRPYLVAWQALPVKRRDPIRVTERLTYWTEPHPSWQPNPEWPEDVGCVLYAGPRAVVLIDPLVRGDGWKWLDEAVAAAGTPVVVLLTAPWHERGTRDVVARYEARVWAAPLARRRIGDLPLLDDLPRGIEVFEPRGVDEGQVAFWIAVERTLVVAEFLLGTNAGLHVRPSPSTSDMHEFVESLRELGELPIERVLVAHGPPILHDGREAVSAALRAFSVEPSTPLEPSG